MRIQYLFYRRHAMYPPKSTIKIKVIEEKYCSSVTTPNTQTHYTGRMKRFNILKQMVYTDPFRCKSLMK
jgi:hypothetical protein